MNSLRKNDVETQVEKKLWKVLGSPVIDVTVKKDSLLVKFVLKFFGIIVGWCSGQRERLGYGVHVRPWVAIKTLSITGQKFS